VSTPSGILSLARELQKRVMVPLIKASADILVPEVEERLHLKNLIRGSNLHSWSRRRPGMRTQNTQIRKGNQDRDLPDGDWA
jgi:hypothetical protein